MYKFGPFKICINGTDCISIHLKVQTDAIDLWKHYFERSQNILYNHHFELISYF